MSFITFLFNGDILGTDELSSMINVYIMEIPEMITSARLRFSLKAMPREEISI